ncbi:MAG TPA: hypothetical protein VMT33_05450 [Candidatus Bathyarchaeia archaeon]|nr:hypothetical protein [Candidatus Bathyarchaeia archaeon]
MTRPAVCLLAAAWILLASCDKVPTADIAPTPEPAPTPAPTPTPAPSGTLKLEVTGSSCGGEVRWTLAGNVHDDDHSYPWSQSMTAQTGDAVSLRACSNECGSEHNVTVTTTIWWKGNVLATQSKSGKTRENHCTPQASASATLP